MSPRRGRPLMLTLLGVALAACGLELAGTPLGVSALPEAGTDANLPPPSTPPPDADVPDADVPETSLPDAGCEGVDLANDRENCGACGRSCRGATCANSVCAPTLLMAGLNGPHGVVVTADRAFVAENAGVFIYRTPLTTTDGGKEVLFNHGAAPRALALGVNGTRLYWVQQTKARSILLDGTGLLENDNDRSTAIVTADDQVFYNELENDNIKVNDVGLGNESDIAGSEADSFGIAVQGPYVYWSRNVVNGTISRRRRDKSEGREVVVTGETAPGAIALGPARIFWTTPNAIRATAHDGGGVARTLFGDRRAPSSLVLAGRYLYWLDMQSGELLRGDSFGGEPLVLARNEPQDTIPVTTAIAVDDTWVYWLSTVQDTGTLKRVPR